MILFVLFTIVTPLPSAGPGTCFMIKYIKETKHEAAELGLHKTI